jgi:hypothetical protein
MARYAPIPDTDLMRYDYDSPPTGPDALAHPDDRRRILASLAAAGGLSREVMERPGVVLHSTSALVRAFAVVGRSPPAWFVRTHWTAAPSLDGARDPKMGTDAPPSA